MKIIIVTFPFNKYFITFSLDYFLNSKLSLIWFLQFFFIKRSNNFFTFKFTNNICPRHSVFSFFNQKNFFRPIWRANFCKNVFIFQYPYMITNFKFRIFIFFSVPKLIYVPHFKLTGFILVVLWYVVVFSKYVWNTIFRVIQEILSNTEILLIMQKCIKVKI